MARKCSFSFDHEPDSWRVTQIKQIVPMEGQPILAAKEWERIKQEGTDTIENWIDTNLRCGECLVVPVGSETAGRRWLKHGIGRARAGGLGVLAVHIHRVGHGTVQCPARCRTGTEV